MKTFFRIIGMVAIIISLAMGGLAISRSQDDKEDLEKGMAEAKSKIAEAKKQAGEISGETKAYMEEELAKAEKQINEGPSESTYFIMQIFFSVLLLLSLAFGVFLFRPNLKTIQLVAGAVLLTVILYFIAPDIKRGEYGGIEDKTMALVVGIPVIIAGLFAFLVAKRSISKTTIQIN